MIIGNQRHPVHVPRIHVNANITETFEAVVVPAGAPLPPGKDIYMSVKCDAIQKMSSQAPG